MGLFDSVLEIVVSPIKVASEVVKDVSGDNGEANVGLSIMTLGASSVIKGTAKSIKNAADKLDD